MGSFLAGKIAFEYLLILQPFDVVFLHKYGDGISANNYR